MSSGKIFDYILGILCVITAIVLAFDIIPIQNVKILYASLFLLLANLYLRK